MTYQTFRFTWNEIEIEARYAPEKWGVIAHLEIESIAPPRAPLPITETGYRSHYCPIGSIEQEFNGDIIAAVKHWLDKDAQTKRWKDFEQAARQYALF